MHLLSLIRPLVLNFLSALNFNTNNNNINEITLNLMIVLILIELLFVLIFTAKKPRTSTEKTKSTTAAHVVDKSTFGKMVTDAGFCLIAGDHPNQLSK